MAAPEPRPLTDGPLEEVSGPSSALEAEELTELTDRLSEAVAVSVGVATARAVTTAAARARLAARAWARSISALAAAAAAAAWRACSWATRSASSPFTL